MATRRPNVPRAAPAAARPAAMGAGAADDGGEVIQADFGGGNGPAPAPSASSRASASADPAGPPAGRPVKGSAPRAPSPRKRFPAVGARPGSWKAGRAAGRPAARDADGTLDPVPAKAFSGRLLALGVVMIAITILLAPTVKIFLDKRAEIAALQADIAAKQATREDLKRQVSRWQDPNYVKQQARDRINMVMPGETGYWVFGSDLPAATSGSPTGAAAQDPANLPWVDALWESVRRSATD